MSAIFRLRNPDGSVLVDPLTHLGRLIGSTTVSADGNLTDAGLADGDPIYIVQHGDDFAAMLLRPNVTFSGTTMTWDFPSGTTTVTIHYGYK